MNAADGPGDAGAEPVARSLRVTYAFAGAAAELTRTAPLAAGERVLLHGAMRLRRTGRLPRPVVLRLTTQRLTLLLHYALQPDRLWDLPRDVIRGVRLERRAVLLSWFSNDPGGISMARLAGWTGRPAFDSSLRDAGAVAGLLRSWLDSPDDRLLGGRPTGHRAQ